MRESFAAAESNDGCVVCQLRLLEAVTAAALVPCADPFLNDETFVTCVATLEELGATGNKVLHSCNRLLLALQTHVTHIPKPLQPCSVICPLQL